LICRLAETDWMAEQGDWTERHQAVGLRILADLAHDTELIRKHDAGLVATENLEAGQTLPSARHSTDFRSVYWFGTDYTFTATQAACVAALWTAWENGTPDVSQEHVLAQAGAESQRLSDVFSGHSAWKTLIVAGGSKGAYRLKRPPRS
jgi:hypothetical protein